MAGQRRRPDKVAEQDTNVPPLCVRSNTADGLDRFAASAAEARDRRVLEVAACAPHVAPCGRSSPIDESLRPAVSRLRIASARSTRASGSGKGSHGRPEIAHFLCPTRWPRFRSSSSRTGLAAGRAAADPERSSRSSSIRSERCTFQTCGRGPPTSHRQQILVQEHVWRPTRGAGWTAAAQDIPPPPMQLGLMPPSVVIFYHNAAA